VSHVVADARARLALRGPQAPVLADRALDAARALGDPTLLARALIVHANAVGPTDVTRKRADLAEAIAEAGASRDPMVEIDAIIDALDDDDKSGREALMPVLRAAVKRGGDTRELRRSLAVAELRVELLAGHWKEAHAACDRALALSGDPHQIARLQEQCSCQIALQERAGPAAVTGCRAAYEAARRDGGDDSPAAAALLSRLGSALERVGKAEEAEASYREAVTRLEALYGPDSELVVAALADWGLLQSEEQHNDQARATLVRARDILDRTGRTDGRLHYGVLSTLAGIDSDLGRTDDAVREINLAVVEGEKFLGPDHPDLATLIANQAQVLAPIKSQRAAAIVAYQRALAIIQKVQPDNPLVGLIELAYGSLLVDGQDYAAASPIAEDAVARLGKSGNPAYVAEANRVLGNIDLALHRSADARAHLRAARAGYVELGAVNDVKAIDKQLAQLR
jgi:tetratricopeptide (TPR) repeat protein